MFHDYNSSKRILFYVTRIFSVVSAKATSNGSVLVTFSVLPLAVSSNQPKDALNRLNYVLSGPGSRRVAVVKEDLTDLARFELLLDGPLQSGTWTLTVLNVETALAEKLTSASTSFVWPVATSLSSPPYSAGYRSIRDFLNPAFKGADWEALVKSLGWTAQKLFDYSRFVVDQMFLDSAIGRWLTKRAQEIGVNRNPLVGFPDDPFRIFAETSVWGKLSFPGLWNALDVFYGTDNTRATAVSGLPEPYNLTGNEELIIYTDNKQYTLYIENSILVNSGSASAFSVTSALNYSAYKQNIPVYFETYRNNNNYYIKAISRIIGDKSSLQFLGGKANQILRFPSKLAVYDGIGVMPTWNITYNALDAATVFTTITTPTGYDLTKVQIGDLALIYGNEFASNNKGTYVVLDVTTSFALGVLTQIVKIKNINPTAQTVAQLSESSLLFFRPNIIRREIGDLRVSASINRQLHIDIPVFTNVTPRNLYSGSYLHDWSNITATTAYRRNGFLNITVPNHNLNQGDWVEIANPIATYTKPPLTPSGANTTSASVASVFSPIADMAVIRSETTSLQLSSMDILIAGGYDGVNYLSSCQRFRVSASTILSNGGRQLTYSWVATASLPANRGRHQLTNMGYYEGFGIVTGGYDGVSAKNTTYRYENSSNTWTTVSNMPYSAFWHSAVAWGTQVLVSGGFGATALNNTASYETFTDTWTSGPNLNYARYKHTYTIHKYNGNVCRLVTGGLDINNRQTNKCEEFNGVAWVEVGAMTWARAGHKALPLPDGKVMVIGGIGRIANQPTMLPINILDIEIYDPESKTWSSGGKLVEPIGEGFVQITPSTPLLNPPDFPIGNKLIVGGGPSNRVYEKLLSESRWKYGDKVDIQFNNPTFAGNDWLLICGGTSTLDVRLYIPGATEYACKGPVEFKKIWAVVDINNIQVQDFEGVGYWSSVSLKGLPVLNQDDWQGPYIWSNDPPMNDYETALTSPLLKGMKYSSINVANAPLDTPPYIMIDFGGIYKLGPIKVFSRESPTRLRIDSEFLFSKDVPIGTRVYGLSQKDEWNPPPNIGYMYSTGSDIACYDLKNYLTNNTTGGLKKNIEIKYPFVKGIGGLNYLDSGTGKLNDKQLIWSGK